MRKFRLFLRGRLFPCTLIAAAAVLCGGSLAVRLPRLLAPVAVLERAFSFAAAIYAATRRETAERKLLRLMPLFMPWVGAICCFWFSAPVRAPRTDTVHAPHGFFAEPPCAEEAVDYFADGAEMGRALLGDLKAAERRIYLEY